MNVLGLVFSLMLILTYGFYACWDKHVASNRLRKTYVGFETAHRKLLNTYQSEIYGTLRSKKAIPDPEEDEVSDRIEPEPKPLPTAPPLKASEANAECAKLNLWPLIQEGRNAHPALYEAVARMIRTFYSSLSKEKRFEYKFLDDLLASAKVALQDEKAFALEKVALSDYPLLYYKMLKGTQEWDLIEHVGYPTLLDYLKVDPQSQTTCLSHAHPDLFIALFGKDIAQSLYADIHRKGGPPLTSELIIKACAENHQHLPDPQLLALFIFGHVDSQGKMKTLLAHEDQVYLRKTLFIPH